MYAQRAYALAKEAHLGQKDKGGNDYIEHPKAVASMGGVGAGIIRLFLFA